MTQSLWLTGSPGIGKSTMLQETLSHCTASLMGFSVTRHVNHGETLGFSMHSLEKNMTFLQEGVPTQPLFIQHGRIPTVDFPWLESFTNPLEEHIRQQKPDLLVMDEIGGIELRSDAFRRFLERMISDYSCVGVLKQISTFKLDQRQDLLQKQMDFEQFLRQQNGEILCLSEGEPTDAKSRLLNFLQSKEPHPKG